MQFAVSRLEIPQCLQQTSLFSKPQQLFGMPLQFSKNLNTFARLHHVYPSKQNAYSSLRRLVFFPKSPIWFQLILLLNDVINIQYRS